MNNMKTIFAIAAIQTIAESARTTARGSRQASMNKFAQTSSFNFGDIFENIGDYIEDAISTVADVANEAADFGQDALDNFNSLADTLDSCDDNLFALIECAVLFS